MTINTFTRVTVERISREIERALAPIAETHGIKITMGRGSFSPTSFTLKVEGAVIAEDGAAVTREAEAFRQLAGVYGMKADDLGRTIRVRGVAAKIVGLNPRAPRMPVIAQDENGKRWKLSAENAQLQLSCAS